MLKPANFVNDYLPTEQDVIDLLTLKKGTVKVTANARLLRQDFTPYNLIAPDDPNDPTSIKNFIEDVASSHNASNDVQHQATFRLREFPGIGDFNTLTDLVQLYWAYYNARGTPILEVPIGVFGFQIPDRTVQDSGNVWDITGYDLTQRVSRCGTMLNTYVVPQGMNIVEAVKAILRMDFLPPSQGGRLPVNQLYMGTGLNAPTTPATNPIGSISTGPYSPNGYAVKNPLSGCALMTDGSGDYHRMVQTAIGAVDVVYNPDGGMLIDPHTGGPIDPFSGQIMSLQQEQTSGKWYWWPIRLTGGQGFATDEYTMADPEHTRIAFSSKYVKFFAVPANSTDQDPSGGQYGAFQTVDPPNLLADPKTGLLSNIYPNYFIQQGGDGGLPTSGNTPQTNVNVTGSGLGYCPLGFGVQDARSGCYPSGQNISDENNTGGPFIGYEHPATAFVVTNSPNVGNGPYVRYVAEAGVKVDAASGFVVDWRTCQFASFGDLPGTNEKGWRFSDGTWMFASPTDGIVYSGNASSPTVVGNMANLPGPSGSTGDGGTGSNNPAPITVTGEPGWPDPANPGMTPMGCDAIGPNFPADKILIEPCDQVALLPMRGDSKVNLLAFVNSLLASINYWPLWCDAYGNIRSGPIAYVSGSRPPIDYTFQSGAHSMLYNPVMVKINDQTSIANVVAVRSENNKAQPLKAVAYNTSDKSYLAVKRLGYTIKLDIQDDNLTTQDLVNARALIELEFASLGAESIEWNMHPWPFFEAHDVVGMNVWSPDGKTLEIDARPNPFIVTQFDQNIRARNTHVLAGRYVPL